MIYLLNVSLSNQYIYTPRTWMHNIKVQYKIYVIFALLILIPYQPYSTIILTISTYISIFLILRIPHIYYLYFIRLFLYSIIFLTLNNLNQVHDISNKNSLINIRLKIGHYMHHSSYIFPIFIIRIGLITILYMISIKLLLQTTIYENILLFIFSSIKKKSHSLQEIMLISSFACQFLEQIPLYINTTRISIKLRNTQYPIINYNKLIIQYIVNNYLIYLKNQISRISSVLYIREINTINFTINIF